ncbi:hypothetical protein HDU98_001387 [Podochytrium sp. JEL0797]|nr:hypothetical protein HDU98_001387 [Podochytrium sp. JEL0797]
MKLPKATVQVTVLARAILAAAIYLSIWRFIRVYHTPSPIAPPQTPTAPSFSLATKPKESPRLHFHIPKRGCPVPKLALIGIISVPDAKATERRNALRNVYQAWNDELPEHEKFEFQYVFGTPRDEDATVREEKVARMEEERGTFPRGFVVLDIEENMNSGKTLAWFNYSRSLAYTEHPTLAGRYCPRYLHIGKGDDDTVIHVPRLSRFFSTAPENGIPNYVGLNFGGFATGMLYFLSTSLVEYIVMQDGAWARQNAVGHEDQVTWKLIQHTNVEVNTVSDRQVFHDDAVFITHRSAVVHRIKKPEEMDRVVALLYYDSGSLVREDAVRLYCAEKGLGVRDEEFGEVMQSVEKVVANDWASEEFIDKIVKEVVAKRTN